MPRIAVVGSGYWGRNHVRVAAQLGVLGIICDSNPEVLKDLASKFPGIPTTTNYDEVLASEQIDGVVIATPAVTHAALARRALLAGKDVLVEKPLALTQSDAEELDRTAKACSRVLMVGHILHYHPAVLAMLEYVQKGRLGKVYRLFSNRLSFGIVRTEENILWSFAPHDISLFLAFAGGVPTSVTCNGGSFITPGVADHTVSCLYFDNGIMGQINVSWLHPYKEHRMAINGSEGMLVFADSAEKDKLMFYPHRIAWDQGLRPKAEKKEGIPVPYEAAEPLTRECEHFLQCMATRDDPITGGANGIQVLSVLRACQSSLDQSGRPVHLSDVGKLYWAHETAIVHPEAVIGAKTKIWQHAQVLKGARIGQRCMIGHNCTVFDRAILGNGVKLESNIDVWGLVTIEDDVFIGPSAVLTNDLTPRAALPKNGVWVPTLIKKGVSIGANATIVCGVTIGEHATVGAGSVVTKDVPAHALVAGNPARFVRFVCSCNSWGRLTFDGDVGSCTSCGKKYTRTADKEIALIPSAS